MQRTLVNLLGNAVKFTPRGGSITISARPDDVGEAVVFEVRDTGEGIPQEAFDRIFEKFGQAAGDRVTRNGSTGLGLTFCKMVAEAHDGRIWVESEIGQGSTFYMQIPARRAEVTTFLDARAAVEQLEPVHRMLNAA